MEALFSNVLTASFHGSIVILAVLLLRFLLRKAPRKYICFLWLLAGLRLLLPTPIQSSLSLQPAPETSRPAVSVTETVPTASTPRQTLPEAETVRQEPQTFPVDAEQVAEEEPSDQVLRGSSAAAPKPTLSWKQVIPYVWLGVAILFGIYTLCAYVRLRLRVREAVKIPGGWECDRIETAFILGFLHPRIYIPMGLPPTVRKYILAHERTHLEKGDHWFKMIGFLALALHWFNPLVWLAYYLLCKDIELACDERVVQFLELEERKRYSAALLQCSTNRSHFSACPVAFGEVSVKERIKKVLSYRRPSFWVSLLAVAAIGFVAVCLLTNPKEAVAPEPEPTETVAPTTEEPPQTAEALRQKIRDALDDLLNAQDGGIRYTATNEDDSTYWQCVYLMHGADRRWSVAVTGDGYSTVDHLVLNGQDYEGKDGLWVACDPVPDPTLECREWFQWDDLDYLGDVSVSHTTSTKGYSYSEIRFQGTRGKDLLTYSFTFSQDGTLQSGSVTGLKTDYGDRVSIQPEQPLEGDWSEIFRLASEQTVTPEEYENGKIPSNRTEYDQNYALGAGQMRWHFLDDSWQFALGAENATATGLTLFYCESDDDHQSLTAEAGFWIEQLVDGKWTLLTPKAEVTNAPAAQIHVSWNSRDTLPVDWTDSYGPLGPGFYRLGRYHTVTMPDGQTETRHCYAKFRLYDPNQNVLLAKCANALDALLARDCYHIYSFDYGESYRQPGSSYQQKEIWKQGSDYFSLSSSIQRTSGIRRYYGSLWRDGKYYGLEWSGEPLTSPLSSWWRSVDGYMDSSDLSMWDYSIRWFDSKVEEVIQEGNTISIYETYDFDNRYQCSETRLTFDDDGNLMGMVRFYLPTRDCAEAEKVTDEEMVVLGSSASEIQQKIRQVDVSTPISFSYEQDVAANPKAVKSGFRNTSAKPVSGVEDAIALADRECTLPHRENGLATPYYQIQVYHDADAGIWKVELYWWQDEDVYQAIYMDEQGITQMVANEKETA